MDQKPYEPGLNVSSELNDIKSAGSTRSKTNGKKLGLNINNINFNFKKPQLATTGKGKDQANAKKMPLKDSLSPMMGRRVSNLLKKEMQSY